MKIDKGLMLTQQAYVDSVKDWSIAAGSAFVRGMRDLGYKSSAELWMN